MRRFLSNFSIALALFASVVGVVPIAHAESCTGIGLQSTCSLGNICSPKGECVSNPNAVSENPSNAVGVATGGTESNTANTTGTGAVQGTVAPAAVSKDANIVANFQGGEAFAPVTTFIMSIFAWLLGVAMVVLDGAVYYTIVKMGDYINGLSAVGVTWRILRDIGNITLIFGFLAIGIATILNVDWYGGKKTLPMLIIVAVLLNFSLFISEAIIDSGNLFATQFYSQINGGNKAGDKLIGSITDEPISNAIMDKLGLATLYGNALHKNDLLKAGNVIFISIFGALLFMVAAFVMFSLAFILIARFVMLLFLIVIAPLGFAGLAVPQLKGTAGRWWSELISQTITAPALLLLLYVALMIITDPHFLVGAGNPDAVGFILNDSGGLNLTGFASYLLSFIVAMGALLAVTMFAKQLGAFGASWATKTAGKLSFGATAWAGRGILGGSGYLLNNKNMQARAAKGSYLAKTSAFVGRALENRTFDVRNLPFLGTAGAAIGAGHPSTITAKEAIDATKKGIKYVKPFSGDWWRDQQKEYEKAKSELDRKGVLIAAKLPTNPPNPESIAAQKELKKMSIDDLAALKGIRGGIDTLVHNLTPEKFNELMKSDKLLAGEKNKLKNTWNDQFNNAVSATTTLSRLNTEETAALGGDTLTQQHVALALGAPELEAVRRKGNLTKDQRHDIYTHFMSAGIVKAAEFNAYMSADPKGEREKYWKV